MTDREKRFVEIQREIGKEVFGAPKEVQWKIAKDYIKTFGDARGIFSFDTRRMFIKMAAALKMGMSIYEITGDDYDPSKPDGRIMY